MNPVTLSGKFVALEPLEESHRLPLQKLAQDPTISTYFKYPIDNEYGFNQWFDHALEGMQLGTMQPFVVKDILNDQFVGCTRYYDIDMQHRTLSLGYTWYVEDARGTHINPEAKFLLFQHAFEVLKINRVVFHVDARNLRSRAAVKKLGAKQEGILRKHLILDNGFVRDTALYSVISDEWLTVRKGLLQRLEELVT